jgi:hypothetical protein
MRNPIGYFKGVRCLIAAALSAMSMSTFAAQWQPVVVSDTGSLFVDLQSIETQGGRIHARVLRHSLKPRFAGDDAYSHTSDIFLVDINCTAGTINSVAANSTGKQFTGNPDPLAYTAAAQSLNPVRTLACDPEAISASLPR